MRQGKANLRPVRPGDRRRRVNSSLAYKVHGDGRVEVYDLDFAAYCLLRDLPIADMIEEGAGRGPSRYRFVFQDGENAIVQLSVDYTNSESAKHADCVRRLKKAIRSTKVREG